VRVAGFPDLRIRRVVLPDDEKVLWSFARDAHERYMGAAFNSREQWVSHLRARHERDPDGMLTVRDREEGVCGYLHLDMTSPVDEAGDPLGHVHDVYVVPGQRGRGIGRALLAVAEAALRERGLAAAQLHVFEENTRAIALYEREGWSTRRTAEAGPGGPLQRLMVKRLVD